MNAKSNETTNATTIDMNATLPNVERVKESGTRWKMRGDDGKFVVGPDGKNVLTESVKTKHIVTFDGWSINDLIDEVLARNIIAVQQKYRNNERAPAEDVRTVKPDSRTVSTKSEKQIMSELVADVKAERVTLKAAAEKLGIDETIMEAIVAASND